MGKVYLGQKSRLSTERRLGELAMTQAAGGDRLVTLRKVTRGADTLSKR
jgi:hypothetical protein